MNEFIEQNKNIPPPEVANFGRICAVFITYNPKENIILNIEKILSQVEGVIIVDNASFPPSKEILHRLIKMNPSIKLISNDYNLGIATALNQGVKKAIDQNFDWVITFDQDSFAEKDLILKLKTEYFSSHLHQNIGILAPIPYDQKTGYSPKPYRFLKEAHIVVDSVITSGSLIRLNVFEKAGYFDDNFFIDYVDHDFCLKLRKEGFRLLLVPIARLAHNYGDPKLHHFLGFSFFSHNYSPQRRYYMARNRIVAYRRHKSIFRWILHDIDSAIKDIAKILFVETEKWKKIKSIFIGTLDGLLNRLGNADGFTYSMPKPEKYFVEWRHEILDILPDTNKKIIDLGCGSGETSFALKKLQRADWVCGIEGHPLAAEIARQRLDRVIEGDIEKIDLLEILNDHVDTVLALDILEHLVDPWKTVEKIYQVLKPDGVLVTSIPNIQHYSTVIPLIFMGDWRYQEEGLLDSTHLRFFTPKTAIQLLTRQGFIIDEITHNGMKKGSITFLINFLTLGLFKNFFIYQIIIRARKPLESLTKEL